MQPTTRFSQLQRPSDLSRFDDNLMAYKVVPPNKRASQVKTVYFAYVNKLDSLNDPLSGYLVENMFPESALSDPNFRLDLTFNLYRDGYPEDHEKITRLYVRTLSSQDLKALEKINPTNMTLELDPPQSSFKNMVRNHIAKSHQKAKAKDRPFLEQEINSLEKKIELLKIQKLNSIRTTIGYNPSYKYIKSLEKTLSDKKRNIS